MSSYEDNTRISCKYGAKCYQTNKEHHLKYKHPNKKQTNQSSPNNNFAKKRKLNNTKQQVSTESNQSKAEPHDSLENNGTVEETHSDAYISDSMSEGEVKKPTKKVIISESEESFQGNEPTNEKIENTIEQNAKDREDSVPIPSPSCEELKISPFDPKKFIKSRFLVEMPDDFYQFFTFCQEIKPQNPSEALKDIGLILVGPFDVLANKFKHVKKKSEDYLIHWRYFYDPPELQTVLKGDDRTGFHIGYFRDLPKEPPVFLVRNNGTKDGTLTKMGDNIFAAVCIYLEDLKKTGDPFKKIHVGKYLSLVKNKAELLKYNISPHTEKTRKRETRVVSKTLNKVGLVVPYNKKTQLGYRDLALNDKDFLILLNKLKGAAPEQKPKILSELQPVFTYASIAIDECDFGTGIKLGWDILSHGVAGLDSIILKFLSNSYNLLNRQEFSQILEAHLNNRKKGCDLSVL